MKNLCVFCGSSKGNIPLYQNAAIELAEEMIKQELALIYGGGSVGLMGILADQLLKNNGKVIGVIPKFLYDWEVGHDGVTELLIVESMHQRKQKMAEISDAFIALPGGFGTLDETAEILTWNQLKLINKPIALLNINGFFDPLLEMFDRMVQQGFLKINNRNILIDGNTPGEIIKKLKKAPVFAESKWIDKT